MSSKGIIIGLGSAFLSLLAPSAHGNSGMKITVLYNNVPFEKGLRTDWGFSCILEGRERATLFDTGGDGGVLLSNMKTLRLDPGKIDSVVISHNHGDHTGGLWEFLKRNPHVTVYVPKSFPKMFLERINQMGAYGVSVRAPVKISNGIHTTGEMGGIIVEQALAVESSRGLVLITGCAHPGIVEIAETAKQIQNQEIFLAMGGFHLMGLGESRIRKIAAELKEMGIKKIAPSHCTGETAIKVFKKYWQEDFVDGGCGTTIALP